MSGLLAGGTLSGLGMAGSIVFRQIGALALTLGSGNDTMSIRDTGTKTLTGVTLGGGTDTVNLGSATNTLSGIQGYVTLTGGRARMH